MHIKYESFVREPLVDGDKTYHNVTEDICRTIEQKPGRMWYVGFFFSIVLLLFGVFSVAWEV
jgi:molybdopterin-containing oxidoreductase family membrane subunit